MGFYIIEINDKYKQVVLLSAEGELYCKDVAGLMPYTEPDIEQVRKDAYEQGRKDGKIEGQAEGWECARKIAYMYSEERKKVFGENLIQNIHDIYSASEAIEKIRQYEQEKEGELGIREYFKNGEEVIDADGTKAVILRVSEDNYCQVYTENGCIENWHIHTYKFHKTGRTFPEIVAVLEKMKEGAE